MLPWIREGDWPEQMQLLESIGLAVPEESRGRVASLASAGITLGSLKKIQPAWVPVALASEHPQVNALLASIITMTPGTVSAVLYAQRREILVHALNCDDAAALARDIQQRYEAPLLRIFGAEGAAPTEETSP